MKEKILSLDNFSQIVTDQNTVLIDFWATWCGPCKMIAPELEKLADEENAKFIVAKCNVDENAELCAKFGIEVIPTLILMVNGKEEKRFSGYLTAQEIKQKFGL